MNRPLPTPGNFRRRRRERRLQRTLGWEQEVSRWATQHGFTLRVLNGGHHWLLQKPGFVAEWWPSSAKLVLNRDYVHDRQAPHWPEVALALEAAMTHPPPLSAVSPSGTHTVSAPQRPWG